MQRVLLILFVLLACRATGSVQGDEWLTFYEKSGGKKTPGYRETIRFCQKMADSSPVVTLLSFGRSAQGRELPLVVVDRDGLDDPVTIRKTGRLVVLIQACIHPGESEGKDAGLMLIRDIVAGKREYLDHISLLFIPIFNVDGHERFGPYNRINQNGPEEMGWRVTASNLNLNRDYLKADTPEMQAWLIMFNQWMPGFFIDTHTTDGADYQYNLTYSMNVFGDMDAGLTSWSRDVFLKEMTGKMEQAGMPVFPYIEFRDWHNPRSGLESNVSPPMLSQAYTSLRNRPGLLIETHMLKPYSNRVNATLECLNISLDILNREKENLGSIIRNADTWSASEQMRDHPFPLRFETDMTDSTLVDFAGIAYTVEKSEITGENWFMYGKTKTTLRIPSFEKTKPEVLTMLPEAYIIPPEWTSVISRLRLHGVRIRQLASDTNLMVKVYRFGNPKWQSNPYEGRHPLLNFTTREDTLTRQFPAGSAIITMDQQQARIIAHLLEPKGNGSFVYWGFFDAIFEQKEYAEHYVMEPMAARMLAENPLIREEFMKKKQQDEAFASNPNAVLNWFFTKTPYWDKNKDLYPVGRIYDRALVEQLIRTSSSD